MNSGEAVTRSNSPLHAGLWCGTIHQSWTGPWNQYLLCVQKSIGGSTSRLARKRNLWPTWVFLLQKHNVGVCWERTTFKATRCPADTTTKGTTPISTSKEQRIISKHDIFKARLNHSRTIRLWYKRPSSASVKVELFTWRINKRPPKLLSSSLNRTCWLTTRLRSYFNCSAVRSKVRNVNQSNKNYATKVDWHY